MPTIEYYALIDDLQTAAVVSRDGSIDWCCFPRFDSGACFASLLGPPDHGRWRLGPATGVRRKTRRYRHDTLILESVHETAEGVVRAIDFMPPVHAHATSVGVTDRVIFVGEARLPGPSEGSGGARRPSHALEDGTVWNAG